MRDFGRELGEVSRAGVRIRAGEERREDGRWRGYGRGMSWDLGGEVTRSHVRKGRGILG